MFEALNPEELNIVLDAMVGVQKSAGELIIKEGDDGDNLYVVEKGILDCTKVFVSFLFKITSFRKEPKSPHS
jgi:cAMP-dependent protein kinase regulator